MGVDSSWRSGSCGSAKTGAAPAACNSSRAMPPLSNPMQDTTAPADERDAWPVHTHRRVGRAHLEREAAHSGQSRVTR